MTVTATATTPSLKETNRENGTPATGSEDMAASSHSIQKAHRTPNSAATNDTALMDLERRMRHSTVNAAMASAHALRDNGRSIAEDMNAQRATVVDVTKRKKPL
jgi:tryptophan synthase beta subunit